MKYGIIVAMKKEADALAKAGIDKGVVLSNMGKVNAAMAATELILSEHPDYIINSGVAGSLNRNVQVGHIVIGTQTAYHDVWCGDHEHVATIDGCPRYFEADKHLLNIADTISVNNTTIHKGLIITGDQFYISQQEDARQLSLYPTALACDMESAAIAQVCHHYNIPFLSIRIISDIHTSDNEQKMSYSQFWEQAAHTSFECLKQIIKKI